jgi:repressor LexA
MNNLSEKQKNFLDYIADFTEERGRAPKVTELAAHFSIKPSTVNTYLHALERQKQIAHNAKKKIKTYHGPLRPVPLAFSIPLLGRINAGLAAESIANVEGEVVVAAEIIKNRDSSRMFALRVQGESMRDAGILDGDLVIVEQVDAVRSGDIVVALLKDEVTVKSYHPAPRGKVELRPANPEFKAQFYPAGQVAVQGKVIALQRTY